LIVGIVCLCYFRLDLDGPESLKAFAPCISRGLSARQSFGLFAPAFPDAPSRRAKRNRAIRFVRGGAFSVPDGRAAKDRAPDHSSLTVAVRGSV